MRFHARTPRTSPATTTLFIPPTQIEAGDRVRIGPDQTAVVRHAWQTDNWAYIEVEDLYYPLMLEPISTVTVERVPT